MDVSDGLEEGEIEDCDISPVLEQPALIQTTRETKTICSDESSTDKSDESDDSSDEASRPKRAKHRPQPPPAPASRNHVPSKYKVWSVHMQEEALTETLTKCDVEPIERERDVESYNYRRLDKADDGRFGDYEMPEENHAEDCSLDRYITEHGIRVGGKRRHGDVKKRPFYRKRQAILLPLLTVTTEDTVDDVAEDIASKLHEEKVDLILNVVLVLGKEKAIALYNETKKVEEKGGIMLMNGSRRRTSGGVFLFLIKGDHTISAENMKAIFAESDLDKRQRRRILVRRRRKIKQQALKEMLIREKLLNLNTEVVKNEADRNSLEDGELEHNVSNPPPSPASDQDTPPSPLRTQVEDDGALSDEERDEYQEGVGENRPLTPSKARDEPDDPHGRRIVSYDDADDYDYVDADINEMDLF